MVAMLSITILVAMAAVVAEADHQPETAGMAGIQPVAVAVVPHPKIYQAEVVVMAAMGLFVSRHFFEVNE